MSSSKRKYVDCRDLPSERNCTVKISGSEEEVITLAIRHAVEDHGHKDTPELRKEIKKLIKNEK